MVEIKTNDPRTDGKKQNCTYHVLIVRNKTSRTMYRRLDTKMHLLCTDS